jgi:flagellar protein FliO/FliZ
MNKARTLYGAAITAALTLTCAAPSASAENATAGGENTRLHLSAPTIGTKSPTSGSSLVRTIVGLAIVIGVIYGLTWVLKQVKNSKEERAAGTGLASLATLPLGPNRSVHLIRSGREYVLVGVAEQGVTPIRRYTEEQALELGLISQDDGEDASGDGPSAGRTLRSAATALGKVVRGDEDGKAATALVDTIRNWTVRS